MEVYIKVVYKQKKRQGTLTHSTNLNKLAAVTFSSRPKRKTSSRWHYFAGTPGLAWNNCDWFNEMQTSQSRTKMIMGAARPFSGADTAVWSGCAKVLWINSWVELMEKWKEKKTIITWHLICLN